MEVELLPSLKDLPRRVPIAGDVLIGLRRGRGGGCELVVRLGSYRERMDLSTGRVALDDWKGMVCAQYDGFRYEFRGGVPIFLLRWFDMTVTTERDCEIVAEYINLPKSMLDTLNIAKDIRFHLNKSKINITGMTGDF